MNRFDGKVTVITGADATQCLTPLTRRGAWRERCRARVTVLPEAAHSIIGQTQQILDFLRD
jgi:hypothetical protein